MRREDRVLQEEREKYRLIEAEKAEHSISRLCKLLGGSGRLFPRRLRPTTAFLTTVAKRCGKVSELRPLIYSKTS